MLTWAPVSNLNETIAPYTSTGKSQPQNWFVLILQYLYAILLVCSQVDALQAFVSGVFSTWQEFFLLLFSKCRIMFGVRLPSTLGTLVIICFLSLAFFLPMENSILWSGCLSVETLWTTFFWHTYCADNPFWCMQLCSMGLHSLPCILALLVMQRRHNATNNFISNHRVCWGTKSTVLTPSISSIAHWPVLSPVVCLHIKSLCLSRDWFFLGTPNSSNLDSILLNFIFWSFSKVKVL